MSTSSINIVLAKAVFHPITFTKIMANTHTCAVESADGITRVPRSEEEIHRREIKLNRYITAKRLCQLAHPRKASKATSVDQSFDKKLNMSKDEIAKRISQLAQPKQDVKNAELKSDVSSPKSNSKYTKDEIMQRTIELSRRSKKNTMISPVLPMSVVLEEKSKN